LPKPFIQKLIYQFSQSAVDGYALCSHAEDLNNQSSKSQVSVPEARVMTYLVKVRQFVYLRAAKFLKGQRM
jgi:hypothetical protein